MMTGRAQGFLLRLPPVARLLLANLAAFRLDRMRRAGDGYQKARGLIQIYHQLGWDRLRRRQEALVCTFLKQVGERVVFYSDRFLEVQGDRGVLDLRDVPPLEKNVARAAGGSILDPQFLKNRHYTGHTSGSTGTPFTFHLTFAALQARFGLRDGFYAYHGFEFSDELNLRLGGRLFLAPDRQRPPFWVRDFVANQILFSVYHISDANMPSLVGALERYRPRWVTGYPSAVHLLARGCRELGSTYRPQGVFTDSETVLQDHREEVRRAWQCAVHDYYGMEVGWVAGQCRRGKYHLSPLTSVVEILDDEGRPAEPGELGELVVTDLTNPLMPLIRYRTGDMAVWSTQPCDCGWNTPTLERIEGRRDDVVTLPDGRRIGRLDHILKGARSIKEAQLVQYSPEEFVLYVVPEADYDDSVAERITEEALLRLGRAVTFRVQAVPRITRTRTGKLRSVVSLVGSAGGPA